jgi:O-antigen ligase
MTLTVLRWIAAGIAALLAVGALACFALFIAFEAKPALERAKQLGAWIRLLALTWFNVEVWGRVVHTIVTWK